MSLVTASQIRVELGQKLILTDVDLCVGEKEIVTLVGPNGAGKSTLLKVILGLIKPQSGKIELKPNIRMGYMPQSILIEPFMPLTVQRFLELTHEAETTHLERVVKELSIQALLRAPLQSISGGELQRVLLARALLRKPDLLVLDEPVQGVDLSGQEELYRLIEQVRNTYHCGVLMVSHDLHLVMAGTDSVICLNQHVCCAGSPAVVSQSPEFLKLFGIHEPARFAVYAHHHDHKHVDGDTCP